MKAKIQAKITYLSDTDVTQWVEPLVDTFIGKPNLLSARIDEIVIDSTADDDVYTLQPGDGAEILYILTDGNLTVKINADTGSAINIVADRILPTDAKRGVLLLTTTGITSLYFTNSGQTSVTAKIIALTI